MRAALALLLVSVVVAAAAWLVGRERGGPSWSAVDRMVSLRGAPDLPTVSTGRLAARLEDGSDRTLLLDVRTEAEAAVSMIPGARRVDPGASAADLEAALEGVGRDRPVVVYCAVGARSAAVGRRLQEVGFGRVENLEGSIFRWANERRPLEDGDGPVTVVHPYNAAWGALLDPAVRADV